MKNYPEQHTGRLTFGQQMVQAYAVNDRTNQLILEHLDSRAWRAQPPGRGGRTIAAIFAHVHNVRRKWLRLSAPHLELPARLDRARTTQEQASAALAASASCCCEMLTEALAAPHGRLERFLRDGWAKPWPPGPAMFAYMIFHDAHHRGQVCMLAHQFGFPLPSEASQAIWASEKLWKSAISVSRPGNILARSVSTAASGSPQSARLVSDANRDERRIRNGY